jgi:hypothetical protein
MAYLLSILCLSFDYFYPESGMKTLSFVPINIGSEWSGRDGLIVIAMRSPGAKQAQHNNEKDWHAGLRKNMGGFVTGFMRRGCCFSPNGM